MLEKILEEIEKESFEPYDRQKIIATDKVKDIICKHMNGGWIPVEERLPGTQKVLITDGEIVMRGYRRPDGTWKYGVEPEEVFSKLSSIGVIAWQPLPVPYQTKNNQRFNGRGRTAQTVEKPQSVETITRSGR